MSIIIRLNEVARVNQFCEDMRTLCCDVDVLKGHYVVDAKSIMGLFSLALNEPVTVRVNTDDENIIKQFEELCTKYCE